MQWLVNSNSHLVINGCKKIKAFGGNTMKNRVTEILDIKYPIIQGAMNWLTDAQLVAAVSNAGGLGILGPNAGQEEPTRDSAEIINRMKQEVIKTKQLTSQPFGMVVVVTQDAKDTMSLINVAIEEKVAAVLINGLPGMLNEDLIKPLKEHGIKTIYRSLNPTVSEAKEAEQMGADIIVATGFDEGGTVPEKVIGTFNIVPTISDAVKIPVLAAGGITDIRHVRAAFALGAEGVYVGSAFLATKESRAATNVKEAIVNSSADDLELFRTLPYYYRSLPTKLSKKLKQLSDDGAQRKDIDRLMWGKMRTGMYKGEQDGYISLGNGISEIHSIQSVNELIHSLMADFVE